jgi:ATP-dependent Clp protease protease subunit
VATFCIGQAMSGGSVVLAAGTKGKRYALPHAKVMIHQPFGGIWGQTEDIAIQAQEILKTKKTLIDLLSKLTGQPAEKVAEDQERDKYFDAHEAKAYGLVDEVLEEGDKSKKEAIAASQETKPGR